MHRTLRSRFSFALLLFLLLAPFAALAQGSAQQTITFLPISNRPVNSAPFQVVAVSSAYLPLSFSVQGPASLNGRLLTLTGVGTVTITASQAGNSAYAAASQNLSFQSEQVDPALSFPSASVPYGTPVSASLLDATASAAPVVDPANDAVTISSQLNSSVLNPNSLPLNTTTLPTYTANESVFRYEGNSVGPSTVAADQLGYIAKGTPAANISSYTVAFSCDCQQLEFLMQARNTGYRLWVDGSFTSTDATILPNQSPDIAAVLVKFPNRQLRQIKIFNAGSAPFYGVNLASGDTLSAPEAPLGAMVMVLGDQWTVPVIASPATGAAQDGLTGSGYAQTLGEYFNWNTFVDGVGGSGYTTSGNDTTGGTFPERAVTDICPNGVNAVVIVGGMNDSAASETSMQSAVSSTLSTLDGCLATPPVYLFGPQFNMPTLAAAMAAAAVSASVPAAYTNIGGDGWIYGSSTSASSGNAYLDYNNNLTPAGHDFIADQIAYTIVSNLPALLPSPYTLMSAATLPGSFSYSVQNGAILPVGTNTLTATFTPTDTTDYATGTVSSNLIVTQATTKTTLSASQANKIVTLTAVVSPEVSGVPTGTVTFYANGNAIGTAQLVNGTATAQFGQNILPPASYSMTAVYSGDTNFLPSTSAALSVVNTPPDFSFTLASSTATVPPGSSTTVTANVVPVGGLVASLAVSCTGLPANTTCALANAPVSLNQNPVSVGVIISAYTPKASAALHHHGSGPSFPWPGRIALAGAFGGLALWRRRRTWARMLSLCLALGLALAGGALTGCGSTSAINYAVPGTYNVTIQLTASGSLTTVNGTDSISHTEPLTLVLP